MQEHWLWKEGRLLDYSDDDLSHWELLVQDLPWPDGITLANIKAMKINEKVAIAYCVNTKKNSEFALFILAILRKVEVLDGANNMERGQWHQDQLGNVSQAQ